MSSEPLTRARFLGATAAISSAALFPAIARAQAQTVRIGVLRIMTDAVYFVADRKGFWKDEGLTIQFQPFESANDMVVPFSQGALDAGGGTPAAGLYNGVARGLTSRLIADRGSDAPGYGTNVLLVRSDLAKSGKVKSVKDLRGLNIAGNEPGSGSSAALFYLLQANGMSWNDVHRQGLPFPLHVEALANGKVDAAFTAEPYATLAVKNGSATKLIAQDRWYPNQQLSAVLFSGDFIKNVEVARRFTRGYVRAARFYHGALRNGTFAGAAGAEIVAILNETMPQKDAGFYHDVTPSYIGPDAKLDLATMKRDLDYFRSQGVIESPTVAVNDVIDPSFLDRALHDLGGHATR